MRQAGDRSFEDFKSQDDTMHLRGGKLDNEPSRSNSTYCDSIEFSSLLKRADDLTNEIILFTTTAPRLLL